MKVYSWHDIHHLHYSDSRNSPFRTPSALTIGGFDGPHSGHQSLLDRILSEANENTLEPGVVTFRRPPRVFKSGEQYSGDVSTIAQKLEFFEAIGMRFVVLIDFSGDFGTMTGGMFLDILVKTVRMEYLAVGPDFRCGHRLDTGAAEIAALARREGFRFDSIRQVEIDGRRVSSSLIRDAVYRADFTLAETLLGRPFLLDLRDAGWKACETGLESDRASFTQILPCQGIFTVRLFLRDGTAVPAVLSCTAQTVTLSASEASLPVPEELAAAQFVYHDVNHKKE